MSTHLSLKTSPAVCAHPHLQGPIQARAPGPCALQPRTSESSLWNSCMNPTGGGERPARPLSASSQGHGRRPLPSGQWKGQGKAQPNTVTLPRSSHKLSGPHSGCKDGEEHQSIHGNVLPLGQLTFGPTSVPMSQCFWRSHMGTRIYARPRPTHSCPAAPLCHLPHLTDLCPTQGQGQRCILGGPRATLCGSTQASLGDKPEGHWFAPRLLRPDLGLHPDFAKGWHLMAEHLLLSRPCYSCPYAFLSVQLFSVQRLFPKTTMMISNMLFDLEHTNVYLSGLLLTTLLRDRRHVGELPSEIRVGFLQVQCKQTSWGRWPGSPAVGSGAGTGAEMWR